MWPAMDTTVGSATNLLATAAPPSAEPPSSWATSSNFQPRTSPASVMAIFPAWEISIPKAELSPVMGAPMPILTVWPAGILAQPKGSAAHAAGGPAGLGVAAGAVVGATMVAAGAQLANTIATS